MPIILVQPAPPRLPEALIRDLVKALREAGTNGKPLSQAWIAALAELERLVQKRPPGDPERTFVKGLRAAAAGKAGEKEWALAALALRQGFGMQGSGTLEAVRIAECLADLQAAQGLPDYPWRDRALAARFDRSQGVEEALEGALLESLKDHWGGFLEPPRREQTLARAADLTALWLRRPLRDRARVMGRVAFVEHAGALWAFAAREGDETLRDRLHECLTDLPPQQLIANLEEKHFLAWLKALREGSLRDEVQALVVALEPIAENRWGFEGRAALLREAGMTSEYLELLTEGLERLPIEGRRDLVRHELLNLSKLTPPLSKRVLELLMEDPVLRADLPLRNAWAARLQEVGMDYEASSLQGNEEPTTPREKGEKGGKTAKGGKDAKEAARREGGIIDPDTEDFLLGAFESGKLDAAEGVVWPLLESLARGEVPGPFLEDELSALPMVLVEPWLRRRAPDQALLRLERMESLLHRTGTVLPAAFTRSLPALRRKVERQQRLLGLLGAAAEP